MRLERYLLLFLFLFLSIGKSNDVYLKNFDPDSLKYKIAYASRCSQPPVIDGMLDDESWNSALPIDEFFQIEPIELPRAVMMHDWNVTKNHVVFMDLPIVSDILKLTISVNGLLL